MMDSIGYLFIGIIIGIGFGFGSALLLRIHKIFKIMTQPGKRFDVVEEENK